MEDYSDLNKAEIGKRLAVLNREILNKSAKINQSVSVPLLLCLEDVMESCLIDGIRQRQVDGLSIGKEINMLIQKFIVELLNEFNDSILQIMKNGFLIEKTIELPELVFGIYTEKTFKDYLKEEISSGKFEGINPKKDLLFHQEIFTEEINGGFIIVLKNGSDRHKDAFSKMVALWKLFYEKSWREELLRSPIGTKVKFDSKGNLISVLKSQNSKKLYDEMDLAIRYFETISYVSDWNSKLRDISLQTLKSSSVKDSKNLSQIKKEQKAKFDAYQTMDEFSNTFKLTFKISYPTFFRVLNEMTFLSLQNPYNVATYKRFELIRILRAKTKIPKNDISIVINILMENKVLKENYSNAILLSDTILFNFHRLSKALLFLSESFFEDYYNNNLKGVPFEDACRKVLISKGFSSIPRRIDIFEAMLAANISFLLWHKLKNRSDIDALCCKDNRIIVLECKHIKSSINKQKMKVLENSAIEHYYKTVWMAENIEKLEDYVGKDFTDKLKVDKKKPIFLVPLMITSKPVDIKEISNQPITYLELKELDFDELLKMNPPGQSEGLMELQVAGKKFNIPWITTKFLAN